ncbi:uncharacterized protein LOC133800247 [Humulus lupulus]|uniref:uncharacterized protein LOC133800247 n=1 Tax=Humulus lupulus TaxID=3486 RepID=UPI002B40E100|nr:uncharacterized protein LOC133800247 [Humulus lupulus]
MVMSQKGKEWNANGAYSFVWYLFALFILISHSPLAQPLKTTSNPTQPSLILTLSKQHTQSKVVLVPVEGPCQRHSSLLPPAFLICCRVISSGSGDGSRRRDSIILSFRDAKIYVLEFDDSIHGLRTSSMHCFEGPEWLHLKRGRESFARGPLVKIDPQGRCASVLVYDIQMIMLKPTQVRRQSHGIKVLYNDGDEEVLNLKREKWEFIEGDCRSDEVFEEVKVDRLSLDAST